MLLTFGQNISSQNDSFGEYPVTTPENLSPTETAYNELSELTELPNSRGDLRARPDDIDGTEHAQKIPLGDITWPMAVIAFLTFVLYKRFFKMKKTKTQYVSVLSDLQSERNYPPDLKSGIISLWITNPQKQEVVGERSRSELPAKKKLLSIFNFQLLIIIALFCCTTSARAQLQATPKNFFIEVGGNLATLDIMSGDNLGNCALTPEQLSLSLVTPMPVSMQQMSIVNNKLSIRPKTDFVGQVVLTYKLTCGADVSQANLYINVGRRPDFIADAQCTVDPPAFTWSIALKNVTPRIVWNLATPLAGDLDGDGISEIIAPNNKYYSSGSDTILIFNHDLTLKRAFPIVDGTGTAKLTQSYFGHPYSLGDVDVDGSPEILVATGNVGTAAQLDGFKLRCYAPDGTLKWTSNDGAGNEISYFANTQPWGGATPSAADMDSDGQIEIVCGDRIFDGASGLLLATLPLLPSSPADGHTTAGGIGLGRGFMYGPGSEFYTPVLADINGDSKLDIIAGNATYDVTLDHSNPAACSVSIIASVDQVDGMTSVADINNDGRLDVVVCGYGKIYVWQGDSPNLIGTVHSTVSGARISRAFIGDVNGDDLPEICHTSANRMYCWRYNGTDIVDLWATNPKATTTDGSGATTMSMFDFNLDEVQELVYRDQDSLRILDANGNNRLAIRCTSATHSEYPIVVDADNDGHAEIYVSGANAAHPGTRIMSFDAGPINNWAPARQTWPQHGYNPVQINDDLTFPLYTMPQTTGMVQLDGTVNRPYNNFLQQTGPSNTRGNQLSLAPDLGFEVGKNQLMTFDSNTDVATVTASIVNTGAIDYEGDIQLSMYAINSENGVYSLISSQTYNSQNLILNQSYEYTIDIPNFSSSVKPSLPSLFGWRIVINMVDAAPAAPVPPANVLGAPLAQECNYANNTGRNISYVSGKLMLCEGESGTLSLQPSGMYNCRWFKSDGTVLNGADADNLGDSKLVTKPTDNWRDYYLIKVYTKDLVPVELTGTYDTVYVYLPADTLVWSGAQSSDWHDMRNWNKPGDDSRLQEETYIPRSCTNVLIPDGMLRYPDISTASTSYAIYGNAACNNIHFEHGGEVFSSDKLTYTKAYVKVEMLGNRWYCFSPPLRGFYSGDIYVNDPNPFNDYNFDPAQKGLFAYTRLFSQSDPQTGLPAEGSWGRTFNTPNYLFDSGEGLGVWIDDLEPNRTIHNSVAFSFPKNDAGYYIYHEYTHAIEAGPFATDRTNSHRFIFEDIIDGSNNIKLAPEAAGANKSILVGNPFMAHLDFNKFYDYPANNSLIENYYRVINADGTYSSYRRDGVSTGAPALTNLVAPMQSILVVPKSAFPARTLVANSSMTTMGGAGKLRSAESEEVSIPKYLRVSIGDNQVRSYTALVYDEMAGATVDYNESVDIYKMLKQGAKTIPNVYFITNDGYYADIKTLSDIDNTSIRIGICGTQTGSLSLHFERIWEFAGEHDVYLVDKYLNKTINVRISPRYNFEKTTEDTFLDDRFELRFVNQTTGIEEEKMPDVQKTVVTKSYYDLSGRPVSEHIAKGFLIQKSVYDDGSVGFSKVYVR